LLCGARTVGDRCPCTERDHQQYGRDSVAQHRGGIGGSGLETPRKRFNELSGSAGRGDAF
jgi:hypothetical protein